MRASCPTCGAEAHIAAFFVEGDGKRLAARLAEMEPAVGRAVIEYLGLFRPEKSTALRLSKALKLVEELSNLVNAGAVCADERSGVRRPTTANMWAQGIEHMLSQRSALTLPLTNHNYLRKVVYGIADTADAAAERQREVLARSGRHRTGVSGYASESPLETQLKYIDQMVERGAEGFSPAEAQAMREEARRKYGDA